MVGNSCIGILRYAITVSLQVSFLIAILRSIWSSFGQQCIHQLVMILFSFLREHVRAELLHSIFTGASFESLGGDQAPQHVTANRPNSSSMHDVWYSMDATSMGIAADSTLWHAAVYNLFPVALPLLWKFTCRMFSQ